ncbi:restriction endonuclease subunit S [Runella salmonicolor]|uniref:Restriction endonuclease subunit S n=1 Tax=Runella salmonicolor TaxID=2950278 RepID=A0ABT1FTC8_9BACT|nr:restriction endonuclease subunit S [Runella salmonicolor]MCP1384952.1 restriction endonuclease subunit S [Runella salmonicolor]
MEKRGGNVMVTNDLKWTTVQSLEVEQAKYRLEANVFNIDARAAFTTLKECKYPSVRLCGLNALAKAHHFGRFKRVFVEKSDMPIFQPSQILDTRPKPDKYISSRTQTDINALRVKKNQILLTCSGTIGKCTIVSETLKDKIFSHDLIRIEANNDEHSGYVFAYLKTKTGQLVLTTNNYGAVIQHIEPEHLENVPIPNAPENLKKEIHEKVIRSFALRDESNDLIDKAEKLLLEALKLPDFDSLKPDLYRNETDVQTFIVSSDQLNDRLEGSFHVPIVEKIIDCLLDSGAKVLPLGSSELTSKIFLPLRFKRIYVEEEHGTVFFGGKQLFELDPSGKKYLSTSIHGERMTAQLLLYENMILVTRSGTVGKVNIVPKHWKKWIANDHVLRITPNSNLVAGYLYIWLNSDFGKMLIDRLIYGSVVDEIEPEHLASVPVPILQDEQLLKEINDLALKANGLRSEAYYLEQEAIKKMNEDVIYVKK